MLYSGYRYSRWDGTQDIFQMDAEDLMDRLSGDLLNHGDIWTALRELMRTGFQDRQGRSMPGVNDLLEQLENRREQQLQRYDLDSVMEDLGKRVGEILKTERHGIQRRLDEAKREVAGAEGSERIQKEALNNLLEDRAGRHLEKLNILPESTGGVIKQLMEYDFMDPEAQRMFLELLDMLRSQMAQNISRDLAKRLQDITPEDTEALREMLVRLNQILQEKAMGREPDFDSFMQQFGPLFGPNPPTSLEELMERLMHQMAQMQSLMESMSPEARQQLESVLDSVLDSETQRELAQLASLMERLMPMDEMRRQYSFLGDESLTLDHAIQIMGNLQEIDELEGTLQEAMRTGKLDQVDPEKIADHLGDEARRTWEQLQGLMEILKEGGYITDTGKPGLTPRAIRRIGQKALKEVFNTLKKGRPGSHEMDMRGSGADMLGETKPYEFGDPFQVDLQASLKNAMVRSGPRLPVSLSPKDFEIYHSEHVTRAATVVLLDQSRSMGLFGSFLAAKKVALALFALIHSQFPRDSMYVIGFSDYAREIKEEDLPGVNWNAWMSGTNIHHALMLSRKLLSREKGGTRQILLITDGEPTAHLEGDRSIFRYPPSSRTIVKTLMEVKRCTQEDILINTFMLENHYQLMEFVDKMTRINRGRVFYSTPDNLGEYLLVDYVTNRRKFVTA